MAYLAPPLAPLIGRQQFVRRCEDTRRHLVHETTPETRPSGGPLSSDVPRGARDPLISPGNTPGGSWTGLRHPSESVSFQCIRLAGTDRSAVGQRRVSDALYKHMKADARRAAGTAGPGGHPGNDSVAFGDGGKRDPLELDGLSRQVKLPLLSPIYVLSCR